MKSCEPFCSGNTMSILATLTLRRRAAIALRRWAAINVRQTPILAGFASSQNISQRVRGGCTVKQNGSRGMGVAFGLFWSDNIMTGEQKHIMKLGMSEYRFHNRVPSRQGGGGRSWGKISDKSLTSCLPRRYTQGFYMVVFMLQADREARW